MPDISIKLIQQGNEWLVERNGQAPEKLGTDPGVARTQIMQFLDQAGLNEQRPVAGPPAEPSKPAPDHETTPTKSAPPKPQSQATHSNR